MDSPLVTVIVPVYNSEEYIKKCIDNIISQTYSNLQIILVDDGSTDDSLSICKKCSDSRVEVFSKTNGGASSARNFGLSYRKGKYVLFVDSDDFLAENAIEILIRVAEENNADCVYYEADNITEDDSIRIKKDGLKHAVQYPTTDGDSLIKLILKQKNYHAVPFLYFANTELYDNGLSFEEGIMFEDELFSFDLLRMCRKVVCLKQVLYYRNVRSGSVMTSSGKEQFRFHSITTVFEKLLEKYNDRNDVVLRIYLARIAMLWLDYHSQLSGDDKRQAESKYQELKKRILEEKGFGNEELRIRCHSTLLWIAYITPEKVLKRLKRK